MTKFINNFIPFSLKANEHFGYSCIALSKIAKASSYFLSFTEHAPFKIDSIFIFFNYIFYQSYTQYKVLAPLFFMYKYY